MPNISGIKYPDKHFEVINRAIPATPTDIATTTVYVTKIRIANRGAAATFTLADKSGTPIEKYEGVTIALNAVSLETLDPPEKFTGGITWSSDTADRLSGTIEGFQVRDLS